MENTYKDVFRIVAPGMGDCPRRGVIRVPPGTYDRLWTLSLETNVSMCRIVEQCVTFALERMEGDSRAN
jgi:hypothetical protein